MCSLVDSLYKGDRRVGRPSLALERETQRDRTRKWEKTEFRKRRRMNWNRKKNPYPC